MGCGWKLVDLPVFFDKSRGGRFYVAEVAKVAEGLFTSAPRIYFIANNEARVITRGGHCHPENGKSEFLCAICGFATVELHGAEACHGGVVLDAPEKVLLIPPGVWHGVTLYAGAVLLVVASTVYSPNECVADKPSCFCRNRRSF